MEASMPTPTGGLLLTPDTSQFFASFGAWPPSGSPAAILGAKGAEEGSANDREGIRARFTRLFTPTTPMQAVASPSLFDSPSGYFAGHPPHLQHPQHPQHPQHQAPVRPPLLPLPMSNPHYPPPQLYPAAVVQPTVAPPPGLDQQFLARYPPVRAFVHKPRSPQDKLETETVRHTAPGNSQDLADIDPDDKEALAKCLSRKTREAALARYRQKRRDRKCIGLVRYDCRKKLADSRPRIKGRFAKCQPASSDGQTDNTEISDVPEVPEEAAEGQDIPTVPEVRENRADSSFENRNRAEADEQNASPPAKEDHSQAE